MRRVLCPVCRLAARDERLAAWQDKRAEIAKRDRAAATAKAKQPPRERKRLAKHRGRICKFCERDDQEVVWRLRSEDLCFPCVCMAKRNGECDCGAPRRGSGLCLVGCGACWCGEPLPEGEEDCSPRCRRRRYCREYARTEKARALRRAYEASPRGIEAKAHAYENLKARGKPPLTKKQRAKLRRYRRARSKANLGRVCRSCLRTDAEAAWSKRKDRCSACDRQVLRAGECHCGSALSKGRCRRDSTHVPDTP